jgi:hypothetical protein
MKGRHVTQISSYIDIQILLAITDKLRVGRVSP